MATRKIKMPSKAMVNLYDMSQEGLQEGEEGLVDNFTNVFDINDKMETKTGAAKTSTDSHKQKVNNKYVKVETDEPEGRNVNQSNFKEGLNSLKNGEDLSQSVSEDVVMAMARQTRNTQKGAGVGRQAFASMTGYSRKEPVASQRGSGRLSFKDMAHVAKKASTLNMAVDAFKSAGNNKQNAFHIATGKAILGKRGSDLSVSKINIEDGVDTGVLSNAELDLFRNIKDLKD